MGSGTGRPRARRSTGPPVPDRSADVAGSPRLPSWDRSSSDFQFVKHRFVIAPLGHGFDSQPEIDFAAQKLFDIHSRRSSEIAQSCTGFSEDDTLLRLFFNENVRFD